MSLSRYALPEVVLAGVASLLALSALTATSARAAVRPTVGPVLLAAAGWQGRPIREPLPSAVLASLTSRLPKGWSAGAVRLGAGYHRPDGSARVRETQRRLRRLGYRPGPVDGRLGPRTASAIAWFQVKHMLPRTGAVGTRTLALLRERTRNPRTAEPAVALAADERRASTTRPETPHAMEATAPAAAPTVTAMSPRSGSRVDLTIPLAVVALAGLLSTALLSRPWRNRRRPAAAPETPVAPSLTVVGYTTATGRRESREAHIALDELCRDRGWSLLRIIHDDEPDSGRMSDRPGLFEALELLASERADGLVVSRLRDLTRSASDLAPLMRWIEDAKARVVIVDVRIDTATESGRTAVRALAEVGAWERSAMEERTRRLATARATGRGNGRPSVHDDPELVAWIGRMRADGMSLQAIADALNEKGVPTLRGGARWRPSSVQSAVGYKRPPADARVPDLPRVER